MRSTVRDPGRVHTRDLGRDMTETAAPRHLSVRFSPLAVDKVIAVVRGELDLYTAPLLQATLLPLPARGVRHIVVDARELLFCDVHGFRSLSEVNDRAVAHGGELVIIRPSPRLRRIATLVSPLIPLFEDLE